MKSDSDIQLPALEIHEEVPPGRYGWGRFTPNGLQKLRSPKWATAFFCTASLTQGIIVNGLLHYFLPMIERRFRLSSTQSGFMSGAYDIAALLFLLPVTYVGGRRGAHKPRYIGYGVIIMGLGSLIFSTPAFLTDPYRRENVKELCIPGQKVERNDSDDNYGLLFWILFLGNFLHGVGASPFYTLVITFIDESVPMAHSSLYLGFYYMMAVVGPFVGIAAGGALGQIDGDYLIHIHKADLNALTPDSPEWVGLWWFGFIICGLASFIFAIPILGLPRELPETRAYLYEREQMNSGKTMMSFTRLGDMPKAIWQVLLNAKFLFITFAGCCEGIILSGMGAFLTKLLHQQFGLTPFEVAIYMCVITFPSTLTGILFGGWVIKFFKMNLKQILIMTVVLMSMALPCIGGISISCPYLSIAGVSIPYPYDEKHSSAHSPPYSLLSECNRKCGCDETNFSPVCGNDDIEYYSPCYAGCTKRRFIDTNKVYENCACILVKKKDKIDAKNHPCKQDCPFFPLFVSLLFVYQTLSFSALIPSVTATLRVMQVDYRSLALGVQWLFGRALGTIPGPVLFGLVIDKACIHWSPLNGKGNCLLYDSEMLSLNLGLVIVSFKILEIVCFSIALCLTMGSLARQSVFEFK